MANLRIPDRYKEGILLLAAASDEAFAEILSALKKAPAHMTNIRELAAWVGPETSSTPKSDSAKIVDALTSLYRLQKRTSFSVSKIAHDVANGAEELELEARNRLQKRLELALPLDALNVTSAKARELLMDREKAYCDAKIVTDIRPVFGDDVDSPEAAIIIHTLKLGFHDSGSNSHKDIYVALDSRDIADLKKILERAELKETRLKTVISAAQLKQVEL